MRLIQTGVGFERCLPRRLLLFEFRSTVRYLFISEEKLKQIPLSNRVAFRVKGAETAMFFCEELFDVIDFMAEFDSLRKAKISTDDLAPKF